MSTPSVAVVMTARGEPVERLTRAIRSARGQTYEGPVEIVLALAAGDPAPPVDRVVVNPSGERSAGLNLAVEATSADIIVRVDARSTLPADYIERCVARLSADERVGVVGGVQRAQAPTGAPTRLRAIARALRNPWATGGAAYRRVGAGGEVDTVYLGVFRRAELLRVGGWNESLGANEDFELCQRYRASGFRVWLEAGLTVGYEPRGDLRSLWRQYFAFGRSKTKYWRHTGDRPNRRQLLPLVAAPLALVAALKKPQVVIAALLGLAALDHAADPKERDARVRAISCVAYVPIVGGWIAGVFAEMLRPESR